MRSGKQYFLLNLSWRHQERSHANWQQKIDFSYKTHCLAFQIQMTITCTCRFEKEMGNAMPIQFEQKSLAYNLSICHTWQCVREIPNCEFGIHPRCIPNPGLYYSRKNCKLYSQRKTNQKMSEFRNYVIEKIMAG